MKYYIDTSQQIYAFELDGSQDKFIPTGLQPISDDALAALRSKQLNSPTQLAIFERGWRLSELQYTDVQLLKLQDGDPTSTGTADGWRKYRVELRGWPEDRNFPNMALRPVRPT